MLWINFKPCFNLITTGTLMTASAWHGCSSWQLNSTDHRCTYFCECNLVFSKKKVSICTRKTQNLVCLPHLSVFMNPCSVWFSEGVIILLWENTNVLQVSPYRFFLCVQKKMWAICINAVNISYHTLCGSRPLGWGNHGFITYLCHSEVWW